MANDNTLWFKYSHTNKCIGNSSSIYWMLHEKTYIWIISIFNRFQNRFSDLLQYFCWMTPTPSPRAHSVCGVCGFPLWSRSERDLDYLSFTHTKSLLKMQGRGVTKAIQSVESFYQWALCVLPQQHPNRHCQLNWPLSMKENNRDYLRRLQKIVDWLATTGVANQNVERHSVSLHIKEHSDDNKVYKYGYLLMLLNVVFLYICIY